MKNLEEGIPFCGDVYEISDIQVHDDIRFRNQPVVKVQHTDPRDPSQWHEFLCITENERRIAVATKLEQNKLHRESLQQLLETSVVETESAFRFITGLSLAQRQLSNLLSYGVSGTADEEGKQNIDPMLSISVSRHSAASILENQHSHLQQKVSRTVPYIEHASIRIKELAERCAKYSQKLDERARQILDQLQETENMVQSIWDTYFNAACVVFQKADAKHHDATKAVMEQMLGGSGSNSTDVFTIGNLWLIELKYRSAVSHQFDEWEKIGTVIQFNFMMAKDAERQRRIKLRQYLHMSVLKPQSAFCSTERAHTEALVDWLGKPDEEVGGYLSSASDENDSEPFWNDVNSKLDTQQRERANLHLVEASQPSVPNKKMLDNTKETQPSTSIEESMDNLVFGANATVQQRVQSIARLSGSFTFSNFGAKCDYAVDLNTPRDLLNSAHESKAIPADQVKVEKLKGQAGNASTLNPESSKKNPFSSVDKSEPKTALANQETHDAERLLYSGTLLESHYVQYAAVVVLEMEKNEESVGHTKSSNNSTSKAAQVDDAVPKVEIAKLCLAVITTDETLHLFDVPEQLLMPSNGSVKVVSLDSKPAEAMQAILLRTQVAEAMPGPGFPSPKTDRANSRQLHVEEHKIIGENDFEDGFRLSPCFSLKLSEYTVRMTRRGGFAVKITKNIRSNSSELTSTEVSEENSRLKIRLKVSSNDDQLALVAAARGQLTRMEV